MPELPEVETVRRGLAPVLEGHRLTRVLTRCQGLRRPLPPRLAKRLAGRQVKALTRRAKYILAELDSGETLVIHLGMSGKMAVGGDGAGKHDHVVFETDAPARIVFTDPRRFGLVALIKTAALADDPLFAGLGVEPLSADFDAAYLAAVLKGKKTPLKSALLDQRAIAGLGNIYAAEALFRARLSPKRLAGRVRANEIPALVAAIKTVLAEAIAAGGASISDHRQTDGSLGHFQHAFRVYDREGQPCPACGGIIKRITQAGRSTFYCPSCQK